MERILPSMTVHDITQPDAAGDAELLARLLETVAVGVHVFDADGVYRLSNDAAERILGVPRDALLGRRYDDPPFRRLTLEGRPLPPQEHPFAVVQRTGQPVQDRQFMIVRPDGGEVVVSVSAAPRYDAHGRLAGVVASYQDLTARVQAEQVRDRLQALTDAALAHLELEDLLHTLLGRIRELLGVDTVAVLLLEPDGQTLRVRAAVGLEEAVARGVRIPLGAGFAGRIAAERRVVALTQVDETTVLNPVLRERGVRSLLGAPLLVGGRVLGVLHVGTLTPRQFRADEARLLQLVADRAALAIEHARLYEVEREARLAAEAAARAKDEFLSLVSHELRTPLTALLGWLQILRSGKLAAERLPQALAVMERSAQAQRRLVEDLLDIARARTGRLLLDVRLVSLGPLIETACESIRMAAEAKGVMLRTTVAPEVGVVRGDETRLLQVLWNLLSNAVKFTPAGEHIDLTLVREGEEAVVRVTDTGIGIPAAVVPTLFEPFRQADTSSTRAYGGLGLGLTLVRQLVELHGGTVEAASAGVGQGATFTVRLPLARLVPEPAVEPVRGDVGDLAAAEPSLAGLAVLVLDDDADTRAMLETLLELAGARVTTAASVGEALDCLAERPVDVVLADLAMPGEDGFAFIGQLRTWAAARGEPVPAIALTAFTEEKVRRLALAAGYQQYLPKPVDASVLLRAIHDVTGGSVRMLASPPP